MKLYTKITIAYIRELCNEWKINIPKEIRQSIYLFIDKLSKFDELELQQLQDVLNKNGHDQGDSESEEINEQQTMQALVDDADDKIIDMEQSKKKQDEYASLTEVVEQKDNLIRNLILRCDIPIDGSGNRSDGLQMPDKEQLLDFRRKAEALAQRTVLENFELRDMINELRDKNFHLRHEIYELVCNDISNSIK